MHKSFISQSIWVMFSSAESPGIVERPHEWFANSANVFDRHHFATDPMEIYYFNIAHIEFIRYTRRENGWRMQNAI